MKQTNIDLSIDLKGDIFQKINDQYRLEQEMIASEGHLISSKMGDIYMEIFKCNENITLLNAECYGSIFINDNHILIQWDVAGCIIEFYYEEYWDTMELTVNSNNCENALIEIEKAFENYYNKIFEYHIEKKDYTIPDHNGETPQNFSVYHLIIEDLSS